MKQLTKEETLASIQQQHDTLLNHLERFSDEEMRVPGVRPTPEPGQACKDVLAHLTAWEQRMLAHIRAILTNVPQPVYPTLPKFNEQIFQACKDRPLDVLRAEFDASYNEIYAFIENLTEEELAIHGVWQLIGYNTYNHYKWANSVIRQWLRAQGKLLKPK